MEIPVNRLYVCLSFSLCILVELGKHIFYFCFPYSNRSLEITRTNGDKLNNGFTGEATNLLRSLMNNRQIGITAVDSNGVSPQIRFYRDTQGTAIERTIPDCSLLNSRTNVSSIENKVCIL